MIEQLLLHSRKQITTQYHIPVKYPTTTLLTFPIKRRKMKRLASIIVLLLTVVAFHAAVRATTSQVTIDTLVRVFAFCFVVDCCLL